MADIEFQMSQLVNLAIGSPEVGAVNFNLLQKLLIEILKLTDLDSAPVRMSAADMAKLEEVHPGTIQSITQSKEDSLKAEDRQSTGTRKSGHQCTIDPVKIDQLLDDFTQLKFDVEDLTSKVATLSGVTETAPFQEMRTSLSKIDGMEDKMKNLQGVMAAFKDLELEDGDKTLGQRLNYLEKHVGDHSEQLTQIDSLLEGKLDHLTNELMELEKEMGELNEKVNMAASSSHLSKKSMSGANGSRLSGVQDQQSSLNALISRLSSVQHDLDNLTMACNTLTEEDQQKQMMIDVLTEQVEQLKLVKADKTNMEDVLAAKADMSAVHRKVSHDHFETRLEQVTLQMEDAFGRLDAHEEMWQEEVEELKGDIGTKLDKMEFSPLKDYVNEKLQLIQERMKALANQKRDGLAAGTKRRVIRDVQCISCDNAAIMQSDNTLDDIMPAAPLPSHPSVKPYLTYQLDKVRKQQKKLPTGRNLLHFEEMLHDKPDQRSKGPQSPRRSGEQLVNRYVGGSHTVTTPVQRVTRTGNFFQTWGPVITAVNAHPPPPPHPHPVSAQQSVA